MAGEGIMQRSQETKAALLKWQQEQFHQRAELAKARALAQNVSHRQDEQRDAAYMTAMPMSAYLTAVECICWQFYSCVRAFLDIRSYTWRWWSISEPMPYSFCCTMISALGGCRLACAPCSLLVVTQRLHDAYMRDPFAYWRWSYMHDGFLARTCFTRRGALIVIRLCVRLLVLLWSAMYGFCTRGLPVFRGAPKHSSQSPLVTGHDVPLTHLGCNDCRRLSVRVNASKNPHAKRSCPGLNPRGGGHWAPSLIRRIMMIMILLLSNISSTTGVRVGSEPTALPGAQNGRLDNEVTVRAKPSGNSNFSGPPWGCSQARV